MVWRLPGGQTTVRVQPVAVMHDTVTKRQALRHITTLLGPVCCCCCQLPSLMRCIPGCGACFACHGQTHHTLAHTCIEQTMPGDATQHDPPHPTQAHRHTCFASHGDATSRACTHEAPHTALHPSDHHTDRLALACPTHCAALMPHCSTACSPTTPPMLACPHRASSSHQA